MIAPAVALPPQLQAGASRRVQVCCRGGGSLSLCRSVGCGCLLAASAAWHVFWLYPACCLPWPLVGSSVGGHAACPAEYGPSAEPLPWHWSVLMWVQAYTLGTKYSIAVAPHNEKGQGVCSMVWQKPYGLQHNMHPAGCVAGLVGITG